MMRIYLPFDDIKANISVLSEEDLGKQRNCAMTILDTIANRSKGWQWHPGVMMWVGYEELLGIIARRINEEWGEVHTERVGIPGIKQLKGDYLKLLIDLGFDLTRNKALRPWWWGNQRFHDGNKAYLYHVNRAWYSQIIPNVDVGLCDWWPQTVGEFKYGPQPGPDGTYSEYYINDKPIYRQSKNMDGHQFAMHANRFHNLIPDSKAPIRHDEPVINLFRELHDRLHQMRVYSSHDHE